MLEIDTSDRNEQRKFGLVMGAAITVVGLIRWAFHGFATTDVPVWFFAVAAVFAALGLVLPRALQPVFIAWIKLAIVLNWIMTRVFLSLAFYLMITPVRVCIALFGDDPLKRKWAGQDESYWEEPDEQPEDVRRYRQMF